jgi:hypothetical protein
MSAKHFLLSILLLQLTLFSCSKEDKGDPTRPAAAKLVFPENQSECTEGNIISETESTITFQWQTASSAETYELHVTPLEGGNSQIIETSENEYAMILTRGIGYEWFIISKSSQLENTETSEKWQFFNQGSGVVNYAPFPAQAIHPASGANISDTTVNLQWSASDLDGDITGYQVYFGNQKNALNNLGSTTQTQLNVNTTVGQHYYWLILTIDQNGNSSQSEIFEFKVL